MTRGGSALDGVPMPRVGRDVCDSRTIIGNGEGACSWSAARRIRSGVRAHVYRVIHRLADSNRDGLQSLS